MLKRVDLGLTEFNELIKSRDDTPKDTFLIGIDPDDSTLSREIRKRVLEECRTNFWYFAKVFLGIGKNTKIEEISRTYSKW